MGAQPVLRVAVAIAVATTAAAAAPVVAVVDGRAAPEPTATTEVAQALTAAELEPVAGDRAAILAGRDPDELAIDQALAEAGDAFGQLDCGRARPWGETAALALAARAVAGPVDAARATRAWSYVLLCADRDGDRPAARHAADRVRALGGSAAVGADVWARYPDIDATLDRDVVALTITGPAGAIAAIDGHVIGPVPTTTLVAAGRHVVAAAAGPVRGAAWVTALSKPLAIEITAIAPGDPALVALAGLTAAVRAEPAAPGIAALAVALDVELVAVVEPDGQIALWQRVRRAMVPVVRGDAAAVARAAVTAHAAAHERAPDPDRPLLREPDAAKPDRDPTRWWVYAALGGAVLAGAAAIYAVDGGDERQRFTLVFP